MITATILTTWPGHEYRVWDYTL